MLYLADFSLVKSNNIISVSRLIEQKALKYIYGIIIIILLGLKLLITYMRTDNAVKMRK